MKKIFGFLALVIIVTLFTSSFTHACHNCGDSSHIMPEMYAELGIGHPLRKRDSDRRVVPIVGVLKFTNVSGDLRLRYDAGKNQFDNFDDQILRMRLGMNMIVNDNTFAELRLTTEDAFATGFSGSRIIGFDRANVTYKYRTEEHKGCITGGKMASPFLRPSGTELMFDRDAVALEGVGVNYINELHDVFVNAGYYNDVISGIQIGKLFDLSDLEIDFIVATGVYDYTQTTGTNAYEGIAEIVITEYEIPITLSGHCVATTDSDEAWTTNLKLGQCGGPWEGELNFAYHSVDPGAVQQWLFDRDYITADGYEIGLKTGIAENVYANVQYVSHNFDDIWRVKSDLTLEF